MRLTSMFTCSLFLNAFVVRIAFVALTRIALEYRQSVYRRTAGCSDPTYSCTHLYFPPRNSCLL